MPLLQLLPLKYWREGAIGGLIVACFYFSVQWKQADAELKLARLAYTNPKTVTVVRTERVTGPVRIKTIYVERPNGEKETTTVEDRGAVVDSFGSEAKSEPVPLAAILPRQPFARLLVGADVTNLDVSSARAWTGYGGVLLKDRLELRVGVARPDHWESRLGFAWIF